MLSITPLCPALSDPTLSLFLLRHKLCLALHILTLLHKRETKYPTSSMSAASFNMKQTLPTQENLSQLLDKLLAIFEVDSVLKGLDLPQHPLQREYKNKPDSRHNIRPISGNDFHIYANLTTSPPSWEAILQLEQTGSGSICVPLCHVQQHSQVDHSGLATQVVEQAALLLRAAWPDASIGPSRRRQLGPDFDDPESASYQLFRWLASKPLNPIHEGVFLYDFLVAEGRRFEAPRPVKVSLCRC